MGFNVVLFSSICEISTFVFCWRKLHRLETLLHICVQIPYKFEMGSALHLLFLWQQVIHIWCRTPGDLETIIRLKGPSSPMHSTWESLLKFFNGTCCKALFNMIYWSTGFTCVTQSLLFTIARLDVFASIKPPLMKQWWAANTIIHLEKWPSVFCSSARVIALPAQVAFSETPRQSRL